MRYELIIGGVVLLACALPVKVLWEKTPLTRLIVCFSVFWGTLAALYFCGRIGDMTAGVLAGLGSIPLEVVAFWLGFILSAVPGWSFLRWGLGDTPTDLPFFFERVSGFVSIALVSLAFPCLVLMTVSVLPGRISGMLPREGMPGRCVAIMERVPVDFYLRTVSVTLGPARVEEHLQRLTPGFKRLTRPPGRGRRRRSR